MGAPSPGVTFGAPSIGSSRRGCQYVKGCCSTHQEVGLWFNDMIVFWWSVKISCVLAQLSFRSITSRHDSIMDILHVVYKVHLVVSAWHFQPHLLCNFSLEMMCVETNIIEKFSVAKARCLFGVKLRLVLVDGGVNHIPIARNKDQARTPPHCPFSLTDHPITMPQIHRQPLTCNTTLSPCNLFGGVGKKPPSAKAQLQEPTPNSRQHPKLRTPELNFHGTHTLSIYL